MKVFIGFIAWAALFTLIVLCNHYAHRNEPEDYDSEN